MRPTTATNDNVFDFQALLHPGTVFEHPKDVVAHPDLALAEKRAILASWASDASAIASCPALRARSKGAGQHRRHLGSPVRPGRRASPSAGREGLQTAVHRARHRGLDH